MKDKVVPEILAPCGSYDILVAAVKAGADACYIGGDRFGARAYAPNLNADSYRQAIEYAHLHNTRIYLTVNTLLKDNEIDDLAGFLQPYYELGLDAVIVQDLGVFSAVKKAFPDMKLHCSTQMNITSWKAAAYMKAQGADRIVTAREMSLDEIRSLKQNVDIEVETFVHGAMCYSYSGQCLMSSFAGGRSGNRGRCAQPCRKCYDGVYKLSMKDMCTLELLPEILETGIDSLKIEGRMKNEYYVASAVDAYKELANDWALGCFSKAKAVSLKKKLANVFNRGGFCSGYFSQHNGRDMISEEKPNNQGVEVGYVEDISAGGVVIRLSEMLYKGDVLELSLDDGSVVEITAHADFIAGEPARLNAPKSRHILPESRVLRTRCNYILEDIRKNILEKDSKILIDGIFTAAPGERISFTLNREMGGQLYSATAYGDVADTAKSGSPDIDKMIKKLSQLGETEYSIRDIHMEVSPDAFVPVSSLKKLRREALELLESEILSRSRRYRCRRKDKPEEADDENIKNQEINQDNHKSVKYRIGISTAEQLDILLELLGAGNGLYNDAYAIYVSTSLYRRLISDENYTGRLKACGLKLYIELPYVVRDNFDIDLTDSDLSVVAGIYVRNIGGYAALKALKLYERVEAGQLELVIGSSLYAYNKLAVETLGNYVYENPQELNLKELKELYEQPHYRGELLLYGYQQVMISAQCVTGNFDTCVNDRSGKMTVKKITDDRGNSFYSRACCDECINVIYNGIPYSILDRLEEVKAVISPESYRVNFTIEKAETVKEILNQFINYNICGQIKLPENVYTAGHIYRGVE
jgi:putative protease